MYQLLISFIMPSEIWQHFSKSREFMKCKYCEVTYQTRTPTTNLWRHLNTAHLTRNLHKSGSASSQVSIHPYACPALNTSQSRNIDEAIADFIWMDMRPFHVVEGDGFKKMVFNFLKIQWWYFFENNGFELF